MSKSELLPLLGWCSLIYISLLIFWALLFRVGHDWIYKLHNKWFAIPKEKFDVIHYALIGFFKILLIVFFLVPYLVLRAI